MKHHFLSSLLLGLGCTIVAFTSRAECQIMLSAPQINYAETTRGELLSRPGNSLAANELQIGADRELNITVNCASQTAIALRFAGPVTTGRQYLFGERGRVSLVLHDVRIDDRPALIASSASPAASQPFTAGEVLHFWQQGQPASGTTLRGKVTLSAWLPNEATRVKDRQSWQLNGSFLVESAE